MRLSAYYALAGLAGLLLVSLPAAAQPTYAKEVSRIVQDKCHICHEPNDIAPFELSSYDDVVTYAADIQNVVSNNIMPPWKPVAGHGDFKNNFGLTDDEKATLLSWLNTGMAFGDPNDLPPPPAPKGDWQLGTPDLALTMAQAYPVPQIKDMYRCFVLPTGLDADKWIQAVEVSPGNRSVVHHVLLFVDESGTAEKLDGQDGQPGYTCFGGPGVDLTTAGGLGAWVPGLRPEPLPDGAAIRLSKTARVIMQVHYNNPGGLDVQDVTKVGLYYNTVPVNKQFRYLPIVPLPLSKVNIPAGDPAKVVTTSLPVPIFDITVWQVGPHMHLLGRQVQLDADLPRNGGTIPLIYIDNWDFNWQNLYSYTNPISLPANSVIKLSCTYDNTDANPKNPNNPVQTVTWGEGTTDEMCLGFVGFTINAEVLSTNQAVAAPRWR